MQALQWHQSALGRALMLMVTLSSAGCVTASLLGFMSDEVAVRPSANRRIDMPATEVRLALKNVSNWTDGPYLLKIPGDWSQRPRQENSAGIIELVPPRVLALERASDGDHAGVSFVLDQAMSGEEVVRQIPKDRLLGLCELGATVDRSEDRTFRIQVFGQDTELQRWVSIGAVELGPGTQSSTRTLIGAVLLPFAVVVDVIALPVYWVVYATMPPD